MVDQTGGPNIDATHMWGKYTHLWQKDFQIGIQCLQCDKADIIIVH